MNSKFKSKSSYLLVDILYNIYILFFLSGAANSKKNNKNKNKKHEKKNMKKHKKKTIKDKDYLKIFMRL